MHRFTVWQIPSGVDHLDDQGPSKCTILSFQIRAVLENTAGSFTSLFLGTRMDSQPLIVLRLSNIPRWKVLKVALCQQEHILLAQEQSKNALLTSHYFWRFGFLITFCLVIVLISEKERRSKWNAIAHCFLVSRIT